MLRLATVVKEKNISGIINNLNRATCVAVHQHNISFDGFLMNIIQSQTLWIFGNSNQCLNHAWSALQCSPGTLAVTGSNVGGCITTN